LKNNNIQTNCNFAILLQSLGNINIDQLKVILSKCERSKFNAGEPLLNIGEPVNKIFFIETGAIRHFTCDKFGHEHTTHFAFENSFATDYRAFILNTDSAYCVEAINDSQFISIPRDAYNWLAKHVTSGEKIIRSLTEMFFVYFATRLHDNYVLSPLERYQAMQVKFPRIYDLVPQYMIASYIGVSKVHLSRLKNQSLNS